MNTHLVISLLITWAFGGGLSALLYYAHRAWFNVLMVAVLITMVLLLIAAVASSSDAMWVSLLLHLALFVYFLFSYISLIIRERKQGISNVTGNKSVGLLILGGRVETRLHRGVGIKEPGDKW